MSLLDFMSEEGRITVAEVKGRSSARIAPAYRESGEWFLAQRQTSSSKQ